MARFCVDIAGIDDKQLEFFGYRLDDENGEFKVYKDKHFDDHIVSKVRPLLYVEDINDAAYLASKTIVALPDDM